MSIRRFFCIPLKLKDLLPDEWLQQAGKNPPPLRERMERFSTDGFQIIIGDQQRLMAELKRVEPQLRKERPNPFAGSMNPYTRHPVVMAQMAGTLQHFSGGRLALSIGSGPATVIAKKSPTG